MTGLRAQIQRDLKGFALDAAFETDGGVLGILGASGSGKSMTMRCIAGIDNPTGGRIELNGRTLYDSHRRINLSPQARRAGYLFQHYALFPNMTVAQNIGCALTSKRHKPDIEQLMERFQITELSHRYPAELSGGQQQRVAVARCLAAKPEMIMLDEPFSALDAQLREQMQLELQEILSTYPGQTILVTHDQREAYRLCSRLAVFDQGRCIAQGATKALFSDPGQVAVARLTGWRNISRAKPMGGYRVMALDWGIELVCEHPVFADVSAVAVRDCCVQPIERDCGENCFHVHGYTHLEDIDAWNTRIALSDSAGAKPIWARLDKAHGIPHNIYIAPRDVLLLRGDAE